MTHYRVLYRTAFVGLLRKYKQTNSEPEDGCSKSPRKAMPRDQMTLSLSVWWFGAVDKFQAERAHSVRLQPLTEDGFKRHVAHRNTKWNGAEYNNKRKRRMRRKTKRKKNKRKKQKKKKKKQKKKKKKQKKKKKRCMTKTRRRHCWWLRKGLAGYFIQCILKFVARNIDVHLVERLFLVCFNLSKSTIRHRHCFRGRICTLYFTSKLKFNNLSLTVVIKLFFKFFQ